jgi:antitoxin component of RelBE/YafQ-DinJ toxin-antitoxin module
MIKIKIKPKTEEYNAQSPSIRIEEVELKKFKSICDKSGCTMTDVIRNIIYAVNSGEIPIEKS